jgi:chondroitin AC lyase
MSDARLEALTILRRRWCDAGDGTSTDGAPEAPADIPALLASQLPDGSWPEVVYTPGDLKDWAAADHLRRLRRLARHGYQAGEASPERAATWTAVQRGLDAWFARGLVNPNWWWNQIGAPLMLGEVLLYLGDACSPTHLAQAEPAFTCHEPILRFTGQNLIWTATVQLYHGLLQRDPDRVSRAFVLIGRELRVLPDEEGIQADMSFHQHGKLLYSGGYGQGFAADVGRLMALAAGTVYAFPPAMVALYARVVLDGACWMVRGRTFDPVACGRELSRQGHDAGRLREGLRHLAAIAHPRQAEAQTAAACDPAAGRSLVIGNRHFWASDLMVQHRPEYYVSVRLPSPRVWNADMPCCGGEGRLCHHLADGVTMIMRDGDEYRDLFPVWDWRQIPGTTVVQAPGELPPELLRRKGERPFAGGASDGQVGCAAVDYAFSGLTARKAYFLFDHELVALGAGITAPGPHPVRTTLDQCHWRGPAWLGATGPLAAGTYPLAPGATLWHDGVAYEVLDGAGTCRLGDQRGAWSDCGVGSPTPLALPVLNLGLDHGPAPAGATYAYTVRPGLAREAAADPGRVVVIANTPALQAVWHARDLLGQAVCYAPGEVAFPDGQRLSVDRPCILLYRPMPDGRVIFTVAQPEQQDGLLTLRLRGRRQGLLGGSLPTGPHAGASLTLVWQSA